MCIIHALDCTVHTAVPNVKIMQRENIDVIHNSYPQSISIPAKLKFVQAHQSLRLLYSYVRQRYALNLISTKHRRGSFEQDTNSLACGFEPVQFRSCNKCARATCFCLNRMIWCFHDVGRCFSFYLLFCLFDFCSANRKIKSFTKWKSYCVQNEISLRSGLEVAVL